MPVHHLDDALLIEYAAGSLAEPVSLVVATHLALCPHCRERVAHYEALGGALLEESMREEEGQAEGFAALLARLDEPEPAPAQAQAAQAPDIRLPMPLRGYLEDRLEALPWKSRGAVKSADLLPQVPGYSVRLMRIRAGAAMPEHSHHGLEMTLVLDGGFSDEDGHYQRGDISVVDGETVHRPVADDDGECLCLVVTDAPLRLTGRFARLLNPLLRI